jgi:hypothetical protein
LFAVDWVANFGEFLHKLRETIAHPLARSPHTVGAAVQISTNGPRVIASARRGTGAIRETAAPDNVEFLERLERIVQPFWTISDHSSREWLDELFAAFHFKIGPSDRSTDRGPFPRGYCAVESWERWSRGIKQRFAAVVKAWRRANRRRLRNEKLTSLKQLAYGASHEINNPWPISLREQLLLSVKGRRTAQHLATIFAGNADEMISDMMLFAHPPAVLQSVDLVELARRALENSLHVEQAGGASCSGEMNAIQLADPSGSSRSCKRCAKLLESRSSGAFRSPAFSRAVRLVRFMTVRL